MKKQEIMDLKLEDVVLEVLEIESYTIDSSYDYKTGLSEDQNFFNSIVCDNKPDITSALNMLTAHKVALWNNRKKELKDYFNEDIGSALEAVLGVVGQKKHMIKDGLDVEIEKDTMKLQYIVDEFEKIKGNKKKEKKMSERKNHGQKVVQVCADTISFITGMNDEKELTSEQVDALQSKYMDVMVTLQSYRPRKAFKLIKSKAPDDIYSADDLELIIEFMKEGIDGLQSNRES